MKKNKGIIVTAMGVLLAVLIIFSIQKINIIKQCKEVSNQFSVGLIEGRIQESRESSTGKMLHNLNNIQELPKADVIKQKTKIVYIRGKLAKTYQEYIIETEKGQDISVIDVYLINKENKWKVYKISEVKPKIKGIKTKNNFNREVEIEETINDFISKSLSGGESGKYLAGPALKSYEQVPKGLRKIDNVKIEMRPLNIKKNRAFYEVQYSIGKSKIELLVELYKLDQWKIISINTI